MSLESESTKTKLEDSDSANETEKGQTKCITLGEALRKKKSEKEEEDILPPLFVKGQQRLLQLYDIMDQGSASIESVRNTAIRSEIDHQRSEEVERFKLDAYLANMEKKALEDYKELDEKWDEISKIQDPLYLKNETAIHREQCNMLLEEKKKVIEYLKGIMKQKDEAFLKEIEDQGSLINVLLNRVEEQILMANEAFDKELESLEEVINEEKKEIIVTNREKWEKLIQEKDQVDKAFIEKICKIIEAHEKPMLLAEKEHLDYKRIMRSKLDKYVNDLILQTEFLKSVCFLNIEKLKYNLQLLLNKQQDNKLIKDHIRKFNTRIGNNLAATKKILDERKLKISIDAALYKKKLGKLRQQIPSIDARCEALARSSSTNYFKLWNYLEEEVKVLLEDILSCDQIIYEECLLLPWVPPGIEMDKPPSYFAAMKLFAEMKKERVNKCTKHKSLLHQDSTIQKLSQVVLRELEYSLANGNNKGSILQISPEGQHLMELNKIFGIIGVTADEHIQILLKYLFPYVICLECTYESFEIPKPNVYYGDEGHCMYPNKYQRTDSASEDSSDLCENENALTNSYEIARNKLEFTSHIVEEEMSLIPKDEKYSWRIDPFTPSYFGGYPKPDPPLGKGLETISNEGCYSSERNIVIMQSEENKAAICQDPLHHLFINPLDVTKALQDYTFDVNKSKVLETTLAIEEVLKKDRKSAHRMLSFEEVADYWESYAKIISSDKIQLWETLISVIQDYLKALEKRQDLNAEMKKTRFKNLELKRLLRQYCL